MAAWPPTLADLKADMGIDPSDTRDDQQLTTVLAAAVAFVARVRPGPFGTPPEPLDDLILGTLRLAGRWHVRRRSPDALIQMGELGASRVPAFDPDIERLLGIGKYSKAVFA